MKKSILLAVMVTVMGSAFAQQNGTVSPLNIHYDWDKAIAYSYQTGYPYGFALAGGSFMSFGFGDGETRYRETALAGVTNDYYQPTWSMRFGWVGYSIDEDVTGWGAVTFRPYVALGMDFMKHYTLNGTVWDTDNKTYFTFAPSFAMNIFMFNFSVGYEIVPRFKELNGINFGIGFSVPASSTNKLTDQAKTYQQNRNKKK